jgi:hypothetical protein
VSVDGESAENAEDGLLDDQGSVLDRAVVRIIYQAVIAQAMARGEGSSGVTTAVMAVRDRELQRLRQRLALADEIHRGGLGLPERRRCAHCTKPIDSPFEMWQTVSAGQPVRFWHARDLECMAAAAVAQVPDEATRRQATHLAAATNRAPSCATDWCRSPGDCVHGCAWAADEHTRLSQELELGDDRE